MGVVALMLAQGGSSSGPTAVTWNPSDKASLVVLSNSNRTATRTGTTTNNQAVRATLSRSSGKYYFEVRMDTSGAPSNFSMVGVCTSSLSLSNYIGQDSTSVGYEPTGSLYTNGAGAAYGATYTAGDVIGVAVDIDSGKVWYAKNNTWQASGNPAAGTSPAVTLSSGLTLFPALSLYLAFTQPVLTARFKSSDLSYSPPSGFTPWDS